MRGARRALKRESKVTITDEIIFFDDVAGNEEAKVSTIFCTSSYLTYQRQHWLLA